MNIYVWRVDDGVSIDGVTTVVLANTVKEARVLVAAANDDEQYWTDVRSEPRIVSLDEPTVVEFNYGGIE